MGCYLVLVVAMWTLVQVVGEKSFVCFLRKSTCSSVQGLIFPVWGFATLKMSYIFLCLITPATFGCFFLLLRGQRFGIDSLASLPSPTVGTALRCLLTNSLIDSLNRTARGVVSAFSSATVVIVVTNYHVHCWYMLQDYTAVMRL